MNTLYPTMRIPHDLDFVALQPRLLADDATVRRLALIDLADLGEEEHLDWLLQALRHDRAAVVRAEAACLLAGWEEPAVVEGLSEALNDCEARVACAAADSLSQLKTSAAGLLLLPRLEDGKAFVRASILRALKELRLSQAAAPAQQALADEDRGVRREAVAVLGWLKYPAALDDLARLANGDADDEVRRAATGALGYGGNEVLPALLRALRDEAWTVREEAAAVLGKLRLAGAAPALITALDDEYWQVRLRAARSLGLLKDKSAVPMLLRALEHPVGNLRKEAAIALGDIGATSALEALHRASEDADPEVRKTARLAIVRIEKAAAEANG